MLCEPLIAVCNGIAKSPAAEDKNIFAAHQLKMLNCEVEMIMCVSAKIARYCTRLELGVSGNRFSAKRTVIYKQV